jgi:UDPglucose 6-dehydrogenase
MPQIAVVGTGYVGLVSGAILSDFGHTVTCVDIDENKINGLKNGNIPIFEPGLERIVKNNYYYKRLDFTTDIQSAIENNDIIFIAVGTPPGDDGSAA